MNILFDICHPADVHTFKNTIRNLLSQGHNITISARDRYPDFELLEAYGFPYYNRGKGKNSIIGKLLNVIPTDWKIYKLAKKNNIDLFVGFGSFYLSHVAFLTGKISIILDDTDTAKLSQLFYRPFATHIITPDVFHKDFGPKHIKIKTYKEISYLHPNYFLPNPEVYKILGIEKSQPYVLIRFVSWNAHHDIGHHGMTSANKIKAVRKFLACGKVFISSEGELPPEIQKYEIQIEPHQMHDVIAGATLLFGESATMASEAAMLGVPSIYIDNDGRSYTDELEEKYGIVHNFTESLNDQKLAIQKGLEIINNSESTDYLAIRNQIMSNNINITSFLTQKIIDLKL